MTAPVAHFRKLTAALEQGRELPPEIVTWWHHGCVKFAAGESKTLCEALGLRGQGINLPVSVYARQTRDQALARALALIEGKSPWARCTALAQQIARFDSITWRRVRNFDEPPARLTPVQKHLFAAFKAYSRVPQSPSRLHELLVQNPVFLQ